MKHSTILLLFTRSAEEEAKAKHLSGSSFRASVAVSKQLISRTLREIRKTGLPYVVMSGDQQRGDGFGQRFTNAMEDAFSMGYEKIIAIGNDAPHLTGSLLLDASDRLQQNDLILGPDKRGGIYLLGITAKIFSKEKVTGIIWKTASVNGQLQTLSGELGWSFEMLPVLQDVNDTTDLKKVLHRKSSPLSFIHAVTSILATRFDIIQPPYFIQIHPEILNSVYRRGPPTVTSTSSASCL